MPSKFGDYAVGRYNVLPKTASAPYTAPEELWLTCTPHLDWEWDEPSKMDAAMDLYVTGAEAEAVLPVSTALDWFEKNCENGFQRSKATVHGNWMEWPSNTPEEVKETGKVGVYARLNQFDCGFIHASGNWGTLNGLRAYGRLVGIAPLVCAGTPYEGQLSLTYDEETTVTVSQTIEQTLEFGLDAQTTVGFKGSSPSISGHFGWSRSTTRSTEVSKSHSESQTYDIATKTWGRIDVRACAGVYVGWIAGRDGRYMWDSTSSGYDVYPFRAPIQVPDFASPVAVHRMSAPVNAFDRAEAALITEHSRIARELQALDGRHMTHDGTPVRALRHRQQRLAQAMRALEV
ncbi:hypothetical protein [Nonomuraea longicatena]|uniref:Uncharacterized protein n=1 Tax=Nonomuraea longicatena TaxID=83682 RepID=A0ABP4APK9_9ACTN